MVFEKRDNSGTLGRNQNKAESKHPDHKGQATINGVDYWVSAWVKQGANGKFFSLSFTPKDAASEASSPTAAVSVDDEIPF